MAKYNFPTSKEVKLTKQRKKDVENFIQELSSLMEKYHVTMHDFYLESEYQDDPVLLEDSGILFLHEEDNSIGHYQSTTSGGINSVNLKENFKEHPFASCPHN